MAECVLYLCKVLLFLVLCVYHLDLTVADDIITYLKPAADFSKHTLVKPKIYHGREKRQISTSREKGSTGDTHVHDLTVTLGLNGVEHVLDLRLNRDLLPKGYFRRYQKNGRHVVDRPETENIELCQYQGGLRGVPSSWAALSTCRKGLSGIIYDGKELHYIERASANNDKGLDSEHFLYKHSDLIETNKTCGYEGDAHHQHHSTSENEFNRILRYKRASEPQIRGPYNANKRSRYVELVLVIDNKEYKDMGESLSKVYQHCKEIANIINGLYSSLNIFIALVGVVVWTEHDEIDLSPSGDKTLTNFLHYRREMLIKEHPNDNAQLLTKFVFDKGVVGKALKGPICTFEYSGGVSMDHSTVVSLVATTVAHEMGHNFGMEHDSNDCQCPEERCIMAPSSSSLWPTHWSSCSLEYLALAFEHGMDYCLRNKPQSLFDSPVCGNGFVEPGEQCDCGLPHTCDNTCCNATTCMLYSNASCATGECCDLKTCRPKAAGSLCRAADYECDLPEYCTGQSEYCPANIYKMDTESCDGGKAFCYQGSCRTRSDQCKLLWGNTGKSSDDQCYNMNTKGSRHGNCGYHRVNQSYIKCEDENVLCGMLHCRHLNERLEFGMESVAILSQSFINLKGSIIPCRTAIVDLGINQVDPGLAPDGAKCGDGKMCVNQKCMAVASLRANINKCPQDCNGNGVCNSLGHCHCKTGFAPPYCDYPGPGGSEDSGPATDPNARKEFVMAMYIVFLGIIPIIAIVAFLMYYTKHNVNFKWQKTSVASKSPAKPRGGTAFPTEPTVRNDDNSSLLQDHQTNSSFQNEFFGQFKGFKLSPMGKNEPEQTQTKPARSAPPVPAVVPTIPSITIKTPTHVSRSNTTQNHRTSSIISSRPLMRTNNSNPEKQPSIANALLNANSASVAPALPPPNPGSNPRPLISSPILENSTCTAKELMSPLRTAPKVPMRSAPDQPNTELATATTETKRPLSSPNANTIINAAVLMPEDDHIVKKVKEPTSTLNRIASFLKSKDDKSKASNNVKANKIMDKNALRTIEISCPIPQNEIEIAIAVNALPVEEEKAKSAVVMRAQSMRGTNVTTRPNIPNFGSMRQPNFKRPTSIPVGNRPKSPPPPRPPLPEISDTVNKIPGLPGYQTPTCKSESNTDNKKAEYHYDDCMNEAPLAKINEELSPNSGDNIYAVIEESPSPKSLEAVKSNSGSSESVGLLGEIVSEIQNRNFDSIYSTSTLARKQKEKLLREQKKNDSTSREGGGVEQEETNNDTYVNTSSIIYKSPDPEGVYSNMGNLKSSASSTASGYIHPSAVNAPVVKPVSVSVSISSASLDAKTTNVAPKTVMSTFKSDPKPDLNTYKPFASILQRSSGPLASSFKTNTNKKTENECSPAQQVSSPTSPTNNKSTKPLIRQTTPPNLSKQISPPISRQTTPPNLTKRSQSPTITRQTTPPNLRTRKPSPTRTVPSSPKNLPKSTTVKSTNSNSPDLVISCSNTTPSSTKSPDVLNSSAKINAKPNSLPKPQNVTPKAAPKTTTKPVIVKSPTDRDKKPFLNKSNSDVKPPISAKIINKANSDVGSNKSVSVNGRLAAAKQASNVASLQQKFENNKPPIASKSVVVVKKK